MDAQQLAKAAVSFLQFHSREYPRGVARKAVLSARQAACPRLVGVSEQASPEERELFRNIITQGLKWADTDAALFEVGFSPEALAKLKVDFPTALVVLFGASGETSGALAAPSLSALRTDLPLKKQFWAALKAAVAKL